MRLLIIILTDYNLHRFAFGFIDELYESYYEPDEYKIKIAKKNRQKEIENSIKADETWLKSIAKKAKVNGITLEEAIDIDVNYIINLESKQD